MTDLTKFEIAGITVEKKDLEAYFNFLNIEPTDDSAIINKAWNKKIALIKNNDTSVISQMDVNNISESTLSKDEIKNIVKTLSQEPIFFHMFVAINKLKDHSEKHTLEEKESAANKLFTNFFTIINARLALEESIHYLELFFSKLNDLLPINENDGERTNTIKLNNLKKHCGQFTKNIRSYFPRSVNYDEEVIESIQLLFAENIQTDNKKLVENEKLLPIEGYINEFLEDMKLLSIELIGALIGAAIGLVIGAVIGTIVGGPLGLAIGATAGALTAMPIGTIVAVGFFSKNQVQKNDYNNPVNQIDAVNKKDINEVSAFTEDKNNNRSDADIYDFTNNPLLSSQNFIL